jgi:hypothetical protein
VSEPEPPLEQRIEQLIEEKLQPLAVMLAAVILHQAGVNEPEHPLNEDPSPVAGSAERGGESTLRQELAQLSLSDKRIEADVSAALRYLSISLEKAKVSRHYVAAFGQALADAVPAEVIPKRDFLFYLPNRPDDAFRRYLKDKGAPKAVLKRKWRAHVNAMKKYGLQVMFTASKDGLAMHRDQADRYIKLSRNELADAVAKSRRKKEPAKKKT